MSHSKVIDQTMGELTMLHRKPMKIERGVSL